MSAATSIARLADALGKQVAEGRLELPVLPGVAAEVMALAQTETTDARKLSVVIHRDQTMASNVLRVANSAAYAAQVPCASLQQAVSRLGLQKITEIVLAVAVRSRVFGGGACGELFQELWRHSVLTGFLTKEIARLRRRNVEIAFLCGLLHDVGSAVLLANVEHLGLPPSLPLDDVAAAVNEHHTVAGGQLARQWRLPDQIVECIECHHDVGAATRFQEMASTVALADLLAHHMLPTRREPAPELAAIQRHALLAALNLYSDQLTSLLERRAEALQLVEDLQ